MNCAGCGYTPGPWKARDYRNSNGDIWIDCNAFANKGKGKCLGGTLATAHSSGTGKGNVEANAKLLAAAPDLLEALQKAHGFISELKEHGIYGWSGMRQVEDALAKATGAES